MKEGRQGRVHDGGIKEEVVEERRTRTLMAKGRNKEKEDRNENNDGNRDE